MDNLYVVMPAYNEEENIENVVKAWYKVLSGKNPLSKLVVADSGSTDTTHERLLKLKETYPQLEILADTGKQHGPKVIALYDYAIKKGADYVFQTIQMDRLTQRNLRNSGICVRNMMEFLDIEKCEVMANPEQW